jgi:hypothetical protein
MTIWNEPPEDDDETPRPGDTDYDLTEEHGYTWEPRRREWPLPGWAMVVVSLLVVAALVLPGLIFLLRNA